MKNQLEQLKIHGKQGCGYSSSQWMFSFIQVKENLDLREFHWPSVDVQFFIQKISILLYPLFFISIHYLENHHIAYNSCRHLLKHPLGNKIKICRALLQTNCTPTHSRKSKVLVGVFFVHWEKVDGVASCIHCSHNVGVVKPFETVVEGCTNRI